MSRPIDGLFVTLTLQLQNLYRFPYLWKKFDYYFGFSFEIYFSSQEKEFPAIPPPKQLQTLLFYQL